MFLKLLMSLLTFIEGLAGREVGKAAVAVDNHADVLAQMEKTGKDLADHLERVRTLHLNLQQLNGSNG